MRLTSQTDYALRVLIYLSLHADRLCTIDEVSTRYGISRFHLAKIAQKLGHEGLAEMHRGRQGGMRLAMSPAEIRIGDVVRTFESDMNIVECFDRESNTCVISPSCKLAGILDEAMEAFLAVLDEATLADVVHGRGKARLLRDLAGD